jgi:hypothetical protein
MTGKRRRTVQAKQPKRMLSVRVSETGFEHITQRAERADVDVSHMVRRMLAYASANMPEGWVPPR